MTALAALFEPRAVAVLGVSRNPAKLGHRLLENIAAEGYPGPVYPVNPAGEPILGRPTLPDVESLPEGVDLALLSLPAAAVADALTRLGRRRVRVAVVLASGFGEVDERGRAAESDLVSIARAARLRLVGPNCMGVYSAPARLNGTYFWDLPRLPGRIAVVSQSGAYGGLIFRHLGARKLGVARFLSIGNQADVEVADVIDYLADDPETSLIACFVEGLRDGRRFVEAARRATSRKPIVVLKAGRSEAGCRAAGSHTGSLAGADEIYRAAFRAANVVLAEETEEFFDAIETLAVAAGRRPTAPRVAVITVSGGPSVVAADAAERSGLEVPPLEEPAREALRALLPPFAAVANPVDLTPHVEPRNIGPAVRRVLDEAGIAGAIAVNVGLDVPEFADAFIDAVAATGKPVVSFVVDAPTLEARFREGGIPVLTSPERAARAWRALWQRRPRPAASPASHARRVLPPDLARAIGEARGPLPYAVARRLLEAYGIPFCREIIAATAGDAVKAADEIGYPVVVKAEAPGLIHKSEAGAVRLDLGDARAVRGACADLGAHLGASRFVVQARVGPGVELLVGARRDPSFGPVVAVGSGGILAEVIRDVSFRLAPLDRDEARAMWLEGARARLAGPRGLPAADLEPLVAAVVAVGELMVDEPRVLELDLNPLIAAGSSALAVDTLVIIGDEA